MNGLNTVIGEIRGMRAELADLERRSPSLRNVTMEDIAAVVRIADLQQLKDMIDVIADRTATLTGECGSLEDQSCALEREIESQRINNGD